MSEGFTLKESRQVTMFVGHVRDSDRAVYAYIDHSKEMIEKLIEENPNWLQEELATYPIVHMEGSIVLRSHKPRKYVKPNKVKSHE